jgi:hypothetical protein
MPYIRCHLASDTDKKQKLVFSFSYLLEFYFTVFKLYSNESFVQISLCTKLFLLPFDNANGIVNTRYSFLHVVRKRVKSFVVVFSGYLPESERRKDIARHFIDSFLNSNMGNKRIERLYTNYFVQFRQFSRYRNAIPICEEKYSE